MHLLVVGFPWAEGLEFRAEVCTVLGRAPDLAFSRWREPDLSFGW